MSRAIDLKDMYQEKAEDLAEQRFGKDFYDLDDQTQNIIYNEAIVLVDDSLILRADSMRKDG